MEENPVNIFIAPPRKRGRPKGSHPKAGRNRSYTYKDPEAISAMRSVIMRKRLLENPDSMPRTRNGGRDRGGHHPDTICPGEKRVTMLALESTRDTFNKCAAHDGMTAIAFMHDLAARLRADPRYAHLFDA